jgi:hypothetical protein
MVKTINIMDKEILHKEIDLIQSIVTRMANNSFLLKGWMITIIVAVLALTKDTLVTNDISYLSIILLLPLLVFWYLDAFFLHKEKCYRELYKWVITKRPNSEEFLYSLDYSRFESDVDEIGKVMFSKTLCVFYGFTALILIGITAYNLFQ